MQGETRKKLELELKLKKGIALKIRLIWAYIYTLSTSLLPKYSGFIIYSCTRPT